MKETAWHFLSRSGRRFDPWAVRASESFWLVSWLLWWTPWVCGYSPPLKTQGRREGTEAETFLGRALFIDFSQAHTWLSLTVEFNVPRDGTTHCGTGPSTPISSWEMPTDMPTGQSDKDNHSLEVPSSWSQIDNQDWPSQWVRLAKSLVCTCRNKTTNQRTPFCLGNRWMPCPRAQTEICILCSASPGKAHFCFLNRQCDIMLFIKGWHKFSFKKNPELWKRKTHFYANPLLELQHLRKQAFRKSVIMPHWIGFPT